MIHSIETKTRDKLEIKRIGYFHDRCKHLYFGKTEDVPFKYKKYIKKYLKYIFIYEE